MSHHMNDTLNEIATSFMETSSRKRHEAYISLERLVRSSRVLQRKAGSVIGGDRLRTILKDFDAADRGLRIAAAKLMSAMLKGALKISTC